MSVWKFSLRLSVGLALFGYLLYEHGVQLNAIFDRMLELSPLVLLGALALNLAGQALSAYRWGRLSALVGRPVAFGRMLQLYFSGMFFNLCLPTSIGGDVFRVVGLSRNTGSKSSATASVFMDRNVGLGALLLIGMVASIWWPSASIEATFFHVRHVWYLWYFFPALLCGYVLANVVLFSDHFCDIVTHLVTRFHLGFVGEKVARLHNAVQEYRLPLARYAWAFVVSLIYQASEIALVWLLAQGFDIKLSPLVFCALVPFQAVASLLPITFSGVGVREGIFCAVLMGQLGPGIKNQAMTLSLTFFLGVVVISSLLGGLVYVLSGIARPTLAEAAESESVAEPVAVGK